MATGLRQLHRWDINITKLRPKDAAAATAETADHKKLRDFINSDLDGQIVVGRPMGIPAEVSEDILFSPETVKVVTGHTDEDWEFTTRAWSGELMSMHDLEVTSVWRAAYNTGDNPGILSSYYGRDVFTLVGVCVIVPPEVDSSRASSQNVVTVRFHPISYTTYGRKTGAGATAAELLIERNIKTHSLKERGVELYGFGTRGATAEEPVRT